MTGIVILAAGSSSRMGQAKQQLVYQQMTLLQRAVKVAMAVPDAVVLVVVGANQHIITPGLKNFAVQIVNNPHWQEGMASSVRIGITTLMVHQPDATSVLLMLCDQPFADTALLQQLISARAAGCNNIIASAYQATVGAPVLFDQVFFSELLSLQGQEGAKKLLKKYNDQLTAIPFEKGGIDIDTPQDYQKLLSF